MICTGVNRSRRGLSRRGMFVTPQGEQHKKRTCMAISITAMYSLRVQQYNIYGVYVIENNNNNKKFLRRRFAVKDGASFISWEHAK